MMWIDSAVVECHGETHVVQRNPQGGWQSECGDMLNDLHYIAELGKLPGVGCQGITRFAEIMNSELLQITGVVLWENGVRKWYVDGLLHRDDGPAVVLRDGESRWYWRGLQHRDDGPAMLSPDGRRAWYQNGRRHRDDGPAVIHANGREYWWRNGMRIEKPT